MLGLTLCGQNILLGLLFLWLFLYFIFGRFGIPFLLVPHPHFIFLNMVISKTFQTKRYVLFQPSTTSLTSVLWFTDFMIQFLILHLSWIILSHFLTFFVVFLFYIFLLFVLINLVYCALFEWKWREHIHLVFIEGLILQFIDSGLVERAMDTLLANLHFLRVMIIRIPVFHLFFLRERILEPFNHGFYIRKKFLSIMNFFKFCIIDENAF